MQDGNEWVVLLKDDESRICHGPRFEAVGMMMPDRANHVPVYVGRREGRDMLMYGEHVIVSFEKIEMVFLAKISVVALVT